MAREIPDAALLALPPDYSLPATEVVRALIRRGARNLRLLGVPVLGFGADLLIGAGCVSEVETSALSLGEAGLAPRFTEAAEQGKIKVKDATCPVIHTALQATEKGVPFMPLRGVLGSDLVPNRPDWKVSQNPFSAEEDPILYVPAIAPDVALFHARWADEAGNVWVGRRRELATIAHASRNTYVTYEERRNGDMLEDELLAPGVISSVYVSAVASAPRGAWPLGVAELYGIDDAHLARYAKAAKTKEGFGRYLDEFVLKPVAA
ncbi:MAG: CoA synthetase [Betaproteobacteria bacterium RIFCSPHIGHO2_12_FULL_69_13]|nr:MAG: CoA synthetase [Betaproteobacteria bacterium RIFCSPHIGHO2_12_FULL_69_13]OGA68227.1 MAG: CoA synthetase [Betaproteobacteria bacterium RIFCSPLOWO2_12_FULL_68_20]